MKEKYDLGEIIENLLQVDDYTWGLYALSKDILKDRIPEGEKLHYIHQAIECGKDYAKRIASINKTKDIDIITNNLGLKLSFKDNYITGNRILFASYTPPNEIEIMLDPIDKAINLFLKNDPLLIELLNKTSIINTIVGHEIFHYLEDQFEKEIYTRKEKLLLWNFFGIKNYSTIRTLGEIAAMAFSKELNELSYSPFILDILLYYSYDTSSAEKIYNTVLGISSGRCNGVENYK